MSSLTPEWDFLATTTEPAEISSLVTGAVPHLTALEDDETPLTQVTSVPRPRGADAGRGIALPGSATGPY